MDTIDFSKIGACGFVAALFMLASSCLPLHAFGSVVYEKSLQGGATLVITCEQLPQLPLPKNYKAPKPTKGVVFGKPMMPAFAAYRFYLIPKDRRNPRMIWMKKEEFYPDFSGIPETGKQPDLKQVSGFYASIEFIDGYITDKTFIIAYRSGNALIVDVVPLIGKNAGKPLLRYPFDSIRADANKNVDVPIVSFLRSGRISGSIRKGTLRIDLVSEYVSHSIHTTYKWNGKVWRQVEGPPGVQRTKWMTPK